MSEMAEILNSFFSSVVTNKNLLDVPSLVSKCFRGVGSNFIVVRPSEKSKSMKLMESHFHIITIII